MKRLFLICNILWIFTSCVKSQSPAPVSDTDCVMQSVDREIFEKIKNQLANDRNLEAGDLVLKIGRFFLETPYVANTLEVGDSEKMVINLRELDCTTFAENCLALARTLKIKNPGFEDFVSQLHFIRYRDGKRNGYPSRLHYFSDWIYNNDQKKTVKSVAQQIAHTLLPNQVNFMSTHPDIYQALHNKKELIGIIAKQETMISNRMTWFIPETRIAVVENKLQDGDILGITTNIEGLDISHVVIAVRFNGRIHFIHASSKEMKVMISEETLEEYLLKSKMASGIMVARPI
jgi:hypothetical protein